MSPSQAPPQFESWGRFPSFSLKSVPFSGRKISLRPLPAIRKSWPWAWGVATVTYACCNTEHS